MSPGRTPRRQRPLPARIASLTKGFQPPRLFAALRESFAHGYRRHDLRADVLAGLTVGVIALPLSMALAIASGVPPQHGLYTAIVAGAVVALAGGSRFQVSGPTAAFVVILAPIAATYGLGGLLVATMMAGLILLALGFFRLGRLIQFIPYPVTAGFTAGIGVVIATLQLPDLFGFALPAGNHEYAERVQLIAEHAAISPTAAALGLGTLALLLVVPRLQRAVPAPLIVLPLAAVAAWLMKDADLGGFETIADRFSYVVDGVRAQGIPQAAPHFDLPWNFAGPDGHEPLGLSWSMLRALFVPALTIALLGAIESLLSAVIADASTRTQHDPDAELIGQGLGNLVAPFFGGIAATGALARTATNIRAGARTPVAAVVHAAFLLLAVIALAPLLGWLPMPSLAAMLLVVAWNMAEVRHVVHTIRTSPRSDVLVLLTCLALTVIFDMVVAVSVGFVLAALLFMRRMIEVADVELTHAPDAVESADKGVMIYAIAGPLFFGAAQKAMSSLHTIGAHIHTVVFDLRRVPAIDATGLVNLRSAVTRLETRGVLTVLAGVQSQPRTALARAGLDGNHGGLLLVREDFDEALREIAARPPTPHAPTV